MLNVWYKFFDRPIGKASSETRLYFAAPKQYLLDMSSDLLNAKEDCNSEGSLNARASYLSGQDIYGDAILASIGYTWRSKDLFYEDVTLQSYHRSCLTYPILIVHLHILFKRLLHKFNFPNSFKDSSAVSA